MPVFRQQDKMEWMLRSWYGREAGRCEVTAWLPKPRPIADAIRKIGERFVDARLGDVQAAGAMWSDIAGAKLAKYSRPVSFRGTLLVVEYDRAVILRELMISKARMVDKLHQAFGNGFCTGVWYAPVGG